MLSQKGFWALFARDPNTYKDMEDSLCANCSILINFHCKLQGFFCIKSLLQQIPHPDWSFPRPDRTWMINRCAVTWDELPCFVTASCAVRLHHSFSFCVVFPLKRLTEPGWVGRAAQFCWQGEMESAWPGVLHQRRGRFRAEHSCFPQSPVTASDCVWGVCRDSSCRATSAVVPTGFSVWLSPPRGSLGSCIYSERLVWFVELVLQHEKRRSALHHTNPKYSLGFCPLLDFLPHSHECSSLSAWYYSKSRFGCSCPTSKLFFLDQPIVVAFTVSAAEDLSGWQKAKKWHPHLEDHSHSPKPKHYLCGEDSSCVITRVGISNERRGCVCAQELTPVRKSNQDTAGSSWKR